MNKTTLVFTLDGLGHGLYTEAIDLGRIGRLSVQRATTIEFDDMTQYWHVKDPTGFAMLRSPSRQTCLDWERQYLESQEDIKHELQHGHRAVAACA